MGVDGARSVSVNVRGGGSELARRRRRMRMWGRSEWRRGKLAGVRRVLAAVCENKMSVVAEAKLKGYVRAAHPRTK